jgi:FkbM family methyltransferase
VLSKHDLKVLLRSRSLRFMRDRTPERYVPGAVASFAWRGRAVHYRPGSSDLEVVYKILLKGGRKAEYWVPESAAPRVIWDIGANIGAAALYFSARFPGAEIHCFEPIRENFAVLERNVAPHASIRAHRAALGAKSGELEIHASADPRNFGGYSFHYDGAAAVPVERVPMLTPQQAVAALGAPAPDFIKIDVEGAEYDILTAFAPELLGRVRWLVGELHSKRSFALLEYLTQWFDIETRKTMGKSLFAFSARNKSN